MEYQRELAEELFERFCHRRDGYGLMGPHPGPQQRQNYHARVREPLTVELVEQHLEGAITLSVYPTRLEDMTCRFLCWDVDDPQLFERVMVTARRHGSPVIEKSGGGSGRRHVWILLEEPRPLIECRAAVLSGGMYQGVDIFPNRDTISRIDFHHELLLKLPLGIHRVTGLRSQFVDQDGESLGPLELLSVLGRE